MPHDVQRSVKVRHFKKDDRVVISGRGVFDVESVDAKTKWATVLFVGGGHMRLEADHEYTVHREEPTEAETLEMRNTYQREYVHKEVQNAQRRFDAAVAALSEIVKKHGPHGPRYSHYGDIMRWQAELNLWHEAVGIAHTQFDGDVLAGARKLVEVLKDRMYGSHKWTDGINRSTNAVSNLMDDIERDAAGEFVRNAKWSFGE